MSIVLTATLLVMPQTAAGYLDPGTGSMLLQGLIALIGGILATVGVYWRPARDFFRRVLGRNADHKSDRADDL